MARMIVRITAATWLKGKTRVGLDEGERAHRKEESLSRVN